MKKDRIYTIIVAIVTVTLVVVVTRDFFLTFAKDMPLLSSFVKFFLLATIGDFIGLRLKEKMWQIPKNVVLKAFIWGIIGIVIYIMFGIYPTGVQYLQENNVLPFEGSTLAMAFFVSLLMNFTFAPTMMSFHRVTDTYLNELADGKKLSIKETIKLVDWSSFFHFTIFRTIPFFWVPAHTITFLLPDEYRIIFAAVLGIVLGFLMGLFNHSKKTENN